MTKWFSSCFPRRRKIAIHPEPLRVYTVPIMGIDGAGKSTVLERLRRFPYRECQPTWGFVNANVLLTGHMLRVYDVGGHQRIRGIWSNYYGESHAAVFVVDGSDEVRLPEAAAALHAMYRTEQMFGKPLLIVVNKDDLPQFMGHEKVMEALGAPALVAPLNDTGAPAPAPLVYSTNARLTMSKGKSVDPVIVGAFETLMQVIDKDAAALTERVKVGSQAQQRKYAAELEERRTRLRAASGTNGSTASDGSLPGAAAPAAAAAAAALEMAPLGRSIADVKSESHYSLPPPELLDGTVAV